MHLVKVYRERYGWSINELSRRSALSPRLAWEIDNSPEYDFKCSTMRKLANVFNLPPSVLFFPKEELEKRRMLVTILQACMDLTGLEERDVLLALHEMKVSNLTLRFAAAALAPSGHVPTPLQSPVHIFAQAAPAEAVLN